MDKIYLKEDTVKNKRVLTDDEQDQIKELLKKRSESNKTEKAVI